MRGHLKQHIVPLLEAVITLVGDKHSADIRSSASLALSKTFEAYVHSIQCGFIGATPAHTEEVLMGCLMKLLEAVRNETDATSRACEIESFRDILLACYNSGPESVDGFRSEQIAKPSLQLSLGIMKELLGQCAESLIRRKVMEQGIASNAGYDAEDRESASEQLDEEEELLTSLTDSLGQLLKVHGPDFMPTFDAVIAPAFSTYLQPHNPASLQIIAVCLVDDAIEFGGEPALKYIPSLVSTLLGNLSSSDNVLRQCSMYGIARAAYSAPEQVMQQLNVILPALVGFVSGPLAEDEDCEGTVENAMFAIGTFAVEPVYKDAVTAACQGAPLSSLTAQWLRHLPLKADEKISKTACRQLCDAIERRDVNVTGENFSNLGDIVRIIAEVLEAAQLNSDAASSNPHNVAIDESLPSQLAHPVTVERMQSTLQYFSMTAVSGVSAQQMQEAYDSLSPELQAVLSGNN